MTSGSSEAVESSRNTLRPRHRWLLVIILACALALRLYGIKWDDGLLFHPDERQLLMVVDQISFPGLSDLSLLTSAESPWNPRFFSYGSFPIYLLRVATDVVTPVLGWFDLQIEPFLVGRILSALADTMTVFLVYLLGKKVADTRVGLVASSLTCLTVLHIQLAHFYTVDTLMTTLVMLTLYLQLWAMEAPTPGRAALVGGALGLAVATKLSAAPLGLCVFFGFLLVSRENGSERILARLWRAFYLSAIAALACVAVFALAEPYALIDMGGFLSDFLYESGMASGLIDVPYTRQFLGTVAYWYPLRQAFLWSVGPALGTAALLGAMLSVISVARSWTGKRRFPVGILVLLAWMVLYFAIVGRMQARFLRYMLPILPVWSVMAALLVGRTIDQRNTWRLVGNAVLVLLLVFTGGYALAYMRIYAEPHTWVQTTKWFAETASPEVTVICEAWDDYVPVLRTPDWDWSTQVRWITFDSYATDSDAKMQELANKLAAADYVVLSSQRLYATIGRLPDRYPLTHAYYEKLMGGDLGYELVYMASVYPSIAGIELVNDTFEGTGLPIPELVEQERDGGIMLGRADESYDVYDHPMSLVFHNSHHLSEQEIMSLLGSSSWFD